MAKDKPPKPKGIPNKHLHARITFLYQAASYLTLQPSDESEKSGTENTVSPGSNQAHLPSSLALQLGSDLHTVSRKAQLRLSIDLKRSMCKSCNAILVLGQTAVQTVENQSKGGRKPWADVLVISCKRCGSKRRMPVGMEKQSKKRDRPVAPKTAMRSGMDGIEPTTSAVHTATEQSHCSS